MTQTVVDRAQLAGSRSASIAHGDLLDAQPRTVRHQQHLGSELHPIGLAPEVDHRLASEGTKPRLAVAKPAPGRHGEQKI